MELWTEYEGITIDGAFPLKKLVLPEGRSAFFSTSNGKGVPTVIRLIASHFDEDEILARWRGVEALGHPNILKLEKYGQLVLDATVVVYAVIEPVDANLAEVIGGQRLTVVEARQLATSLTSALDVLHTNGFVHEHVEPGNVFAVGEVVKLRGDCIREAPEGDKGLAAKRRDIHDLAVVVLQALTQTNAADAAARDIPLPEPFDQIVRNGMSGAWGATEIMTALQTEDRPAARHSAAGAATNGTAKGHLNPRAQSAAPVAKPAPSLDAAVPKSETTRVSAATRSLFLDEDEARGGARKAGLIVAAGLVAIALLWVVLHFAHSGSAKRDGAVHAPPAVATAPGPVAGGGKPGAAKVANSATGTGSVAVQEKAIAGSHGRWRVVAYTYNYEDQARSKSAAVAQKRPELRPEVFSPRGRAPYLVTVGGEMSRDQAFAFAEKARRLGLPRDTYAQNYGGKQR